MPGIGSDQPIVAYVDEARPYTALPTFWFGPPAVRTPRFSSDHAIMAGAVTAGLFLVSRCLGALTAIAPSSWHY